MSDTNKLRIALAGLFVMVISLFVLDWLSDHPRKQIEHTDKKSEVTVHEFLLDSQYGDDNWYKDLVVSMGLISEKECREIDSLLRILHELESEEEEYYKQELKAQEDYEYLECFSPDIYSAEEAAQCAYDYVIAHKYKEYTSDKISALNNKINLWYENNHTMNQP